MTKLILAKQKTRGRPATGTTPMIGLRASPELRTEIERWADRQSDTPRLSEAIRRLVDLGLKAKTKGWWIICASASGLETSAAFAILAAALWLWSSLIKTPDRLAHGPQKNLFLLFDEIHVSLKRQSRRSAWAAMAAAIAAALQGALVFAPLCIAWPF
jgi:hypothetical protein